jgi:hypothetical protein
MLICRSGENEGLEFMTETRSKSLSIVYNGTEIWEELKPYLQSFSYTDGTDQSDTISFTLNDRDKKWSGIWTPQKKDIVHPTIEVKNWNYEGEQLTIACGDFNVAHEEIDLANPDGNHMSAGFTDEEREGFSHLLAKGFVDSFRYLHGNVEKVYSYGAYGLIVQDLGMVSLIKKYYPNRGSRPARSTTPDGELIIFWSVTGSRMES